MRNVTTLLRLPFASHQILAGSLGYTSCTLEVIRVSVQFCSHAWSKLRIPANEGQLQWGGAGPSYRQMAHQFFMHASTITALNQDRHLPTWILEREWKSPKTFRSQWPGSHAPLKRQRSWLFLSLRLAPVGPSVIAGSKLPGIATNFTGWESTTQRYQYI